MASGSSHAQIRIHDGDNTRLRLIFVWICKNRNTLDSWQKKTEGKQMGLIRPRSESLLGPA